MPRIDVPFIVKDQTIKQSPVVELAGGGKNYFYATFAFNELWSDIEAPKATFARLNGKSYVMPLTPIDNGYECEIPWEVMETNGMFSVGVFGGDKLNTDVVFVKVVCGCSENGEDPKPPTVDWYASIEKQLETIEKSVEDSSKETETRLDEVEGRIEAVEEAVGEVVDGIEKQNAANRKMFSNALTGELHGAIVRAEDVSPLEDDLDVKVTTNELFVYEEGYTETDSGKDGTTTLAIINGKPTINTLSNSFYFSFELHQSKNPSAGRYRFTVGNLPQDVYVDIFAWSDQGYPEPLTDFVEGQGGVYEFELEEWQCEKPLFVEIGGSSAENSQKITDAVIDISLKRVVDGEKLYRYENNNLFENDTEKIKLVTYMSTTSGALVTKGGYEINLPVGTYTVHAEGEPTSNDFVYGLVVKADTREVVVPGLNLVVGSSSSALRTQKFTINEGEVFILYNASNTTEIANAQALFSRFNIQIELGSTKTAFEPYVEPEEFTINEDGTVDIKRNASAMTLCTYMDGATIEWNYNRDINKVIEQLTYALISTGGNI